MEKAWYTFILKELRADCKMKFQISTKKVKISKLEENEVFQKCSFSKSWNKSFNIFDQTETF